ncbi:ATP-binding cassette domain-containing protein [Lysinibacillus macroides]|uniref:ATP-binding cassette domain-containing protein n=1 Tax=Lysinibacillus macroides TaxID=33935 RepID=UPI0006B46442|nr:ATP-binding cassette domain-containing protein [Lysinibacillus macroides]QPR70199.1 ATP-binding cassette domain-containing protein [Lysinibacillus macroides]
MLAGLSDPDDGMIIPSTQSLKIGYVPEITPAHILFTPTEYLYHMGRIRGMAKQELIARINELLKLFYLEDAQDTRITYFSKGMKQKIMIMQAMLEETDLLILDEPLSGLDLQTQNDLEETLRSLKQQGLTIVLTCHETKLLDHLVDTILMIRDKNVIHADLFIHSTALYNKLIFEIADPTYLDDILHLMKIQQQSSFATGSYEVTIRCQAQHTDVLLQQLLHKEASIKQLMPIHNKEKFIHND